jgi:hypothetical protein
MAHQGPSKHDGNWKRELENEQKLTPQELKQKLAEELEEKRIVADYEACLRESILATDEWNDYLDNYDDYVPEDGLPASRRSYDGQKC